VFSGLLCILYEKLSLGELGCATCGFETVLLAFLHSRVTGQVSCCLECCTVILIDNDECACDAVADCTCLAGYAAACDSGFDVDLAEGVGENQGLTDDELQGLKTEVIVDITTVDGDSTGAVGDEVNASDRLLSASGTVHIGSLALISSHYFFLLSVTIPNFGLLGCMGVLCTCEDAKATELPLCNGVLLEHSANCKLHCELGALLHEVLVLGLLESADPTRVSAIVLLLELLAGEDCVLCVDDDDIVTAVNMRSIGGLELAAKKVCGNSSGLAEGLACCIKDIPFSFNGFLGKHSCGHFRASKKNINIFDIFRPHYYNVLHSALYFYTTRAAKCQQQF